MLESLFNKSAGLKKRLQQRCFRMIIAKFLRTPSFIEDLRWLLLYVYHLAILRSNITSQITFFLRECCLDHYGGQLKTAVEQEAGEKIDCKR